MDSCDSFPGGAPRLPFLGTGGGEPSDTPLPDQYEDITPTIPAIAAQATPAGRLITLSVSTAEGLLMAGYGDPEANTHPIDVIGLDPDTGVATTFLNDLATEAIFRYRVFEDGSVWGVSVDPTSSQPGFIVTNRGGTWRSIVVDIPALTVPVHLQDVAEADGVVYVSGSRDILPAEGEGPEDEGAAIVWGSSDLLTRLGDDDGATWVEHIANFGNRASEFNRFWDFGKANNRLAVTTQPLVGAPQGYYTLSDGIWSDLTSGPTFYSTTRGYVVWGDGFFIGAAPFAKWTFDGDTLVPETIAVGAVRPLAALGERYVLVTDAGRTVDSELGDVGVAMHSAAYTPDGRLFVSDGEHVYRVTA